MFSITVMEDSMKHRNHGTDVEKPFILIFLALQLCFHTLYINFPFFESLRTVLFPRQLQHDYLSILWCSAWLREAHLSGSFVL